jgi:hypothetical protein
MTRNSTKRSAVSSGVRALSRLAARAPRHQHGAEPPTASIHRVHGQIEQIELFRGELAQRAAQRRGHREPRSQRRKPVLPLGELVLTAEALHQDLLRVGVHRLRDLARIRGSSSNTPLDQPSMLPGLIGLNLMGSSMWGVGVQRKRRLLRRLAVTPMRRSHMFLAYFSARSLLLVLELFVLRCSGGSRSAPWSRAATCRSS